MAPKTHVYGFVPNTHVYGLKFLGFGSALNLVSMIMIIAALAMVIAIIKFRHLIPDMFSYVTIAARALVKGRSPA